MVAKFTIETHGFRPKRWWTLDKNFLFPSTMSLNHGKDQIFVWEKLRKCNHDLKFYFWGKSAFFCNNMVAMVTIETPGFRPKRWLTLDKNFLFLLQCHWTMSKIKYLFRKNYANVITISNFIFEVKVLSFVTIW